MVFLRKKTAWLLCLMHVRIQLSNTGICHMIYIRKIKGLAPTTTIVMGSEYVEINSLILISLMII